MSQIFRIHTRNPQPRLICQAAEILAAGGIIVYPTDCCYALGCELDNKKALEIIGNIRKVDKKHHYTLVCQDLKTVAQFAQVPNASYRILKRYTPGPYTFILKATREVPRRIQNVKRKTIGIRLPDHPVAMDLLAAYNQPIISSTLLLPGDELPLFDADEIAQKLGHVVDLVIDGGCQTMDMTTVVDLADNTAKILRVGAGDPTPFML